MKGSSTSRKLFDMVLELHQLELEGELHIVIVHVAGTWLIANGIDGLS